MELCSIVVSNGIVILHFINKAILCLELLYHVFDVRQVLSWGWRASALYRGATLSRWYCVLEGISLRNREVRNFSGEEEPVWKEST